MYERRTHSDTIRVQGETGRQAHRGHKSAGGEGKRTHRVHKIRPTEVIKIGPTETISVQAEIDATVSERRAHRDATRAQ